MNKPVFVLDGSKFSNFQEFTTHFSEVVLSNYIWKGNLDAFNDILRGGFGTPEGGFVIQWKNSEQSRKHLGYLETVLWYEERVENCHLANVESMKERMNSAKNNMGSTLFDWIVEIIEVHCEGGEEAEDGLELVLL